ncbi:MAG: hydroxymethylglutaryl-CoA synthase family protein, partial [Chloroflexi bacterium]|nr:hydroxymethylglutaryl-CoA synthase family protein [Chloroflexota bacterium]
MAGIIGYGAYVPLYRLGHDAFRQAWGMQYSPGEKAVACYDEDSVTMALAAAFDCVGTSPFAPFDTLYLASTTLPYKEKQMASLLAEVMDLPKPIRTVDFADSLRCATSAMSSALDAVKSGSAHKALVTAADCRMGVPTSAREQIFGDGAAALLFDDRDVAVEIQASHSVNTEITDVWRKNRDPFVTGWEDRWAILYGYLAPVQEAVKGVIEKAQLTPKDFARVVLPAPDYRSHQELVRSLGFDPKTQAQDPLFGTVGAAGAAHALMMLVSALEQAKPGDRILLANYGNGADAFIL